MKKMKEAWRGDCGLRIEESKVAVNREERRGRRGGDERRGRIRGEEEG